MYAVDAVHEFPFRPPGVPGRLEGREEIVSFITAGWRGGVPKYDSYRTVAVHETGDPQTLVVEQEAVGVSASGRAFRLPNIVVLTVADGRIAHLRDYVDVPAAMAVIEEAEAPVSWVRPSEAID